MDTKAGVLRHLQLCPTWADLAGGLGDKLSPGVASPTQRGTRDSPGWRTTKDGVHLEGPKSERGRVYASSSGSLRTVNGVAVG